MSTSRKVAVGLAVWTVLVAVALGAVLALNRPTGRSLASRPADGSTGVGSDTVAPTATSDDALAEHAVEHLRLNGYIASGQPQVILVRDLRRADQFSTGSCGYGHDASDPRYRLVIVRGDLDFGELPGSTPSGSRRARFVALVYDASDAGDGFVEYWTSPNGGSFREILGDPSLPDDVAPGAPPGTRQADLSRTEEECPPITREPDRPGEIAPTVAPPPTMTR